MTSQADTRSTTPISARLLPGVPLVESPLFAVSIDAMGLTDEERVVARDLNERGYAVIDFPDPAIDDRIDRIKASLSPRYGIDPSDPDAAPPAGNLRIQDAWQFDEDVRAIAANAQILGLLEKLYGRRTVPFQTLNFPVGTQQQAHADSAHFSSQPERFMCGVWLAMEDITDGSGPLLYYSGSHKWPIVSNAMIGRRGWNQTRGSAQAPFEAAWGALAEAHGIEPETFLARKGQALIWAANLLHGGSPRTDPTQTRWSQVTHYYFENCIYYTPAFSDEPLGRLEMRVITNIATGEIEPNRLTGEDVMPYQDGRKKADGSLWQRLFGGRHERQPDDLPADFDAKTYLMLNPDVAAGGGDAATHYLAHGREEQRRYRKS